MDPTAFTTVTNYTSNLAALGISLPKYKPNDRVFATDGSVSGANWSQTH